MKVIGLCGGSGSGKGTVSRFFLECGIPSIDTDSVYREITNFDSPCLSALALEFGEEILTDGHKLDRKKLAAIVFAADGSAYKLEKLNEITHHFILDEVRKKLSVYENEAKAAVIVDAPALFESGFNKECDLIVCVTSDEDKRISRIVSRDSISPEAARLRIKAQITDAKLISMCDYVITNNGDLSSLKTQTLDVAEKILENKFER